MTYHSEISPSKAKRVINCSGSVSLSRDIVQKESEYAKEGSAAHLIGEYYLSLGQPPNELLDCDDPGKAFPQHSQYIDHDMINHVQGYYDFVRGECSDDKELRIEASVDLGWIYPGMVGTVDARLTQPFGLLQVIDLKYGAGVDVDVVENEQLMLYALGVLGPENEDMIDEVELIIYQPRTPGEAAKRWKTTPEHLYKFAEEFKTACITAEQENASLKAGDWCQFCPAAAVCPEIAVAALEQAQTDFAPEDEIEDIIEATKPPDPRTLKPDQIAKLIEFLPIFTSWAEKVKAYATQQLIDGKEIPGLKLVLKRSFRRWIDGAEDELRLLYGDSVFIPLSPAKVEKVEGVSAKDIEHLWEKGRDTDNPNDLMCAPLKDRRKAVNPVSAADDFLA